MEQRMNKEEIIKLIESLEIDYEEFWILSSSALVLRGLYPDAGDLDIAVTKKGFEDLKKKFNLVDKNHNGFFYVKDRVECVIDEKNNFNVEKYGKYNLESLDKYLKYLKESEREKDKLRIPIVEKAIEERDMIR